MKMIANDIRVGWVIALNGKQWTVLKTMHTQPGKGGAYMQVEMKDVQTGTKTNERFRSSESVEKLMVEEQKCQFLFADGDSLTFMYCDTYEQFTLDSEVLGERLALLQDGMVVHVSFIEGKPVSVHLPKTVICTIEETEGVVKGQTAASSGKPALLDNGLRITVPPFINAGEKVVVNTDTLDYVERAKG